MKILTILLMLSTANAFSMGAKRPKEKTNGGSQGGSSSGYCQEFNGVCGFNYSSGYENWNKPWGGYLKCRITYFVKGQIEKKFEKIYYTNCGTCMQAVTTGIYEDYTSIEGPISNVVELAGEINKICAISALSENTYDKDGWSFQIDTLEDGSTCKDFKKLFSFPSKKSEIGNGRDECRPY